MPEDLPQKSMGLAAYLGRWISTAFWRAVGPVDLWSGVAGLAVGALGEFIPEWKPVVADLAIQASLWAVLVVVVVRIVLAPYWMLKEEQANTAAAREQIKAERQRATATEERLRPKIEIRFDANDVQNVHKTNFTGKPRDSLLFVSVTPSVIGEIRVERCEGYVNRISQLSDDGKWTVVWNQRLQLDWSARGSVPTPLDSMSRQALNVFLINKDVGRIQPTVGQPLNALSEVFNHRQGTYKFELVVSGAGVPSATAELVAKIGNAWDEIDVRLE